MANLTVKSQEMEEITSIMTKIKKHLAHAQNPEPNYAKWPLCHLESISINWPQNKSYEKEK